jgi:hypothetical protein
LQRALRGSIVVRQQNSRVVAPPVRGHVFETKTMKRLLAELGVIVAGVLIALAADSAWSNRSDRLREIEILRDLREEFNENSRILRADMEMNEASLEAGRLWARAMLGDLQIPGDSLAGLYEASWNNARFDPVTGVLQGVLASGDLSIIQNVDLRQALAGWPDRAEEARNTSENANIQRSTWAPALSALEPGGTYTPGEIALIRLNAERSNGGGHQLQPLLDHVDSIQRLIDLELIR